MALCRYMTYLPAVGRQKRWGWVRDEAVFPLDDQAVARVLTTPDADGLNALAATIAANAESIPLSELDTIPGRYGHPSLVAPILSSHEIWGAGVTYESSKFARIAESASGGDFYAAVYVAERPEIFFKSTPNRTVGANDEVRIRKDTTWNVPEPELTVLIAGSGQILGYSCGNDMSSRDIEGENPLYLPQAKIYTGCCAIGPVVVPAGKVDARNIAIRLLIERSGETAFDGETNTGKMRRNVEELRDWLFRENSFPQGVLLLTGTGIVPPDDFTLQSGDQISITFAGIGTLRNRVAQN